MSRNIIATVTGLVLVGCSSATSGSSGAEAAGPADPRMVHVAVMYRERIMVPAPAELRVWIADVSKQDVAATTIAERRVPITGGPPYRVTLEVPAAAIVPRGRYAARAEISSQGRPMFRTDQGIGVLTAGAPDSVEITVRMQ